MSSRIPHWFVSRPWGYNLVQTLAGARQIDRKLAPLFADEAGKCVLDVGGGTGRLAKLLPGSARYVCLDNSSIQLHGLSRSGLRPLAVIGDAGALPLADRSIDVVACIAVAHHLAPPELASALREMSRVCRQRLVFLDAQRVPGRAVSELLWKHDRGHFPHSDRELQAALNDRFDVVHVEYFTVWHRYLVCIAAPRA
ncbi:MAG: class I SAM-dependent methyltransferase [Anaerolineae bacterium]|jgi:ubiquinone/menaquinone biosynthesis C-methylase UbiE|nr:class I SAM-dependent methyltransferase [Anaerolineae bacterium]